MALDPSKQPVFRGGQSLTARPGIDVTPAADGLLHPTRNGKPDGRPQGLSLHSDPAHRNVASRGAYRVVSIPAGLAIIQDGNTGHCVIAPVQPMTLPAYQGLLNQVQLVKAPIP